MLVLPIKQQMCPADFHHHQYQSSEPHHVHLARVHYCCVTGDRNLNCAVYTVSNVADDDANTYTIIHSLFYTIQFVFLSSLDREPRFRDASSSGAGLILVTTTISVLRSCRVVSLRRQHVELFILCDAEQSITMMFQQQHQQQQQQQRRRRRRRLAHVCVCTLHAEMLNRQ